MRRNLKAEAALIVDRWAGYEELERGLLAIFPVARAGGHAKRRKGVAALIEADRLVRLLNPHVRRMAVPKYYRATPAGPQGGPVPVPDILAAGGLAWLADLIGRLRHRPGRPREWALLGCAIALGRHFKGATGRQQWARVYDCLRRRWSHLPQLSDAREKRERITRLLRHARGRGSHRNLAVSVPHKAFPDLPPRVRARRPRSLAQLAAHARSLGIGFQVLPRRR